MTLDLSQLAGIEVHEKSARLDKHLEAGDDLSSKPAAHAKRSPSSAHRWLACPGSAEAEAQYEDRVNEYAAWGTYAHEISENCLLLGLSPKDFLGQSKKVDGFRFVVNDEMVECCDTYVNAIRTSWGQRHKPTNAWLERKVRVNDECWGTADHILRAPDWVGVDDLKSGFITVEATAVQLRIYGVGALRDLEVISAGAVDAETVRTRIIQPRAIHEDGPIREHTWTVEELDRWTDEVLIPGIKATYEPDAPFIAGDHCKYCEHQANCPAFAAASKITEGTIGALSNQELGEQLDAIPLMKERIKALETEGLKRVSKGAVVPGKAGAYKAIKGKKHRTWRTQAFTAAKALPAEAFRKDLKTPAQLTKLGQAGKDFVSKYAYTPEGDAKLVPADAKGEALPSKSAKDLFAQHLRGKKHD